MHCDTGFVRDVEEALIPIDPLNRDTVLNKDNNGGIQHIDSMHKCNEVHEDARPTNRAGDEIALLISRASQALLPLSEVFHPRIIALSDNAN
jgi:hypothetical protein